MFSDDILEKIFSDKETKHVPIGYQSTMVSVIEKIITELREENPDAKLSTLLSK